MAGLFSCLAPFASRLVPDHVVLHNLKQLEAMLKNGRAWLDGEEAEVAVDDPQTEIMNKVIREWAYRVEDVLDEWKFEQLRADVEPPPPRRFGRRYALNPVANFLLERDFRRKVDDLIQRMEEIGKLISSVVRLQLAVLDSRLPVCRDLAERQFQSHIPVEVADGRDDDREILVRFLLEGAVQEAEQSLSVVAILGAAGVGKTTLIRQLYLDPMVCQHFSMKAWVRASRGGRLILKVKRAILSDHLADWDAPPNHNQLGAVQELLEREITGQRLFLVLDDVSYETIDGGQWEELSAAFRGCKDGSVVILITQEERAAERTATLPPYILEPLPGDLSWSLFRKHAFSRSPSPENPLVGVGKKIAKDCHGFPLFAKALGSRLRRVRDLAVWEEVSSRGGMWDDVLPLLKLSYDRLPAHLKKCFVYCSMFPRGYLFSREELVRLWMAHGFIEEQKGGRSLEDVGIEYFDDLWMMSFFHQSELDVGAFVLPNPLHAVAQSISNGKCIAIENSRLQAFAGNDRLQKALHLSLTASDSEWATDFLSTATHLRSLVVIPTWPLKDVAHISLSDAAFHSLNHLRVLDLRHTDLEAVPIAIGDFKHLRYLNLSGTKIKHVDASVFKSLYHLQTLDLGSTEIRELPDTIGNLRSLFHLHLNVTMITELPESIGKLSKLQTLQLVLTKIEELPETIGGLKGLRFLCVDVSRVQRGLESICWMSNLQALELQGTDDGESDNNDISSYSDSEEQFNVRSDQIIHNRGTKDMADSSTRCNQSDHVADRDSSSESQTLPQLGLLPLLKTLLIDGMSLEHIGHEFCGSSNRMNGFPNLTNLSFKNMSKWKEWDAVGEADFPQLSELIIFNCPKLKGVPCLHSPLTKLKVERCAVESIPTPASLKELDLVACDNLVTLPSLSSLHSLTLMYCQKLRSLSSVSLLENTKNLWIEECDKLTTSFSDELNSFPLSLKTFAR